MNKYNVGDKVKYIGNLWTIEEIHEVGNRYYQEYFYSIIYEDSDSVIRITKVQEAMLTPYDETQPKEESETMDYKFTPTSPTTSTYQQIPSTKEELLEKELEIKTKEIQQLKQDYIGIIELLLKQLKGE
jgi:hypothetical protein